MIHIVFEQASISVLKQAIALDESLNGNILEIKDDFAVGPIAKIFETEGYQERKNWWENALLHSPYTEQMQLVDDKLTVHNVLKQLEENNEEQVWIWMAQNQHDVCSYYWLVSQLKNYQGRIHVLYLNNLPFINEKGQIFYPQHLHEIQPKEFLKAKKLARPITLSEFEIDPDEFLKLCDENATIRILEGGKKIVSKEASFYDKELLTAITNDNQKLTKILNNVLTKMKVKTGDVFLVWRLKQLAFDGKLVVTGDWEKGWKEIEVSLPNTKNEEI
ncbi:MAG: DUF1835 domain-containing protein [Chitinophagaceae bacterium]|jgi:hypothetical protein